ncbi:dihydroorotate dehydrogenase [Stieleria sp.]|uniref:dihydroorotate dehydrogenase n=1 Tax=Stieleria sp. TaxID=2795976 RepID=UPI0035642894
MSIDLSTNFGGLHLKAPIVVGSCPMTAEEPSQVALVSAGAGAIVLPSLFQEQVLLWNDRHGIALSEQDQSLLKRSRRVPVENAGFDAESYLKMVTRASSQLSIPVIASLNGESGGNWLDFAKEVEQAGAAAIELCLQPPPPSVYGTAREVEDAVVEVVTKIDHAIKIPLFVKLHRSYTRLSQLSCRLLSGAQGLILFGRLPDTDISLDTFELKSEWTLTEPGTVSKIIGPVMQVHSYCPGMPLAACGGIGTSIDVVKALLAGADVAMVTSAVCREGPTVVRTLIDGLRNFMERHHMKSLDDLFENRPLEFDSESQRNDYLKGLTARFDPAEVRSNVSRLHGDRWGHPTSDVVDG